MFRCSSADGACRTRLGNNVAGSRVPELRLFELKGGTSQSESYGLVAGLSGSIGSAELAGLLESVEVEGFD